MKRRVGNDTRPPGARVTLVTLGALFLAAAALLVEAVVISAGVRLTFLPTRLESRPILEIGPAVALTMGLITLLAVRSQFKYSLQPVLAYARLTTAAEAGYFGGPSPDRHVVILSNSGLGPAIIERVSYGVTFRRTIARCPG